MSHISYNIKIKIRFLGNTFSEENYKICMKCNNKKHMRNDNLEIIKSCLHRYDYDEYKTLTFR